MQSQKIMTREATQKEEKDFRELEKLAHELGAKDCYFIPAENVVIENRTTLRCDYGCEGINVSRVCPPHIMGKKLSIDEFRGMMKEYRWTLWIEWDSDISTSGEIGESVHKLSSSSDNPVYRDPRPEEERQDIDPNLREGAVKFFQKILQFRKQVLQPGTLEIEKRATNMGYHLAFGLYPGACGWCYSVSESQLKCVGPFAKTCKNPLLLRPCLMGLGINVNRTFQQNGLPEIHFPIDGQPKQFSPRQFTIVLL